MPKTQPTDPAAVRRRALERIGFQQAGGVETATAAPPDPAAVREQALRRIYGEQQLPTGRGLTLEDVGITPDQLRDPLGMAPDTSRAPDVASSSRPAPAVDPQDINVRGREGIAPDVPDYRRYGFEVNTPQVESTLRGLEELMRSLPAESQRLSGNVDQLVELEAELNGYELDQGDPEAVEAYNSRVGDYRRRVQEHDAAVTEYEAGAAQYEELLQMVGDPTFEIAARERPKVEEDLEKSFLTFVRDITLSDLAKKETGGPRGGPSREITGAKKPSRRRRAELVGELTEEIQQLPTDPYVVAAAAAAEDTDPGQVASAVATLREIARGGTKAVSSLVLSNTFNQIPPILGSTAGLMGGGLGAGLGAFIGTMSVEQQAAVGSYLVEAGVDITNPDALLAALADPDTIDEIKEKASDRGFGVAAVEGIATVVTRGILRNVSSAPARTIAGLASETVGEGLGEIGGQIKSGEDLRVGEGVIEAAAAGGQSTITTAILGAESSAPEVKERRAARKKRRTERKEKRAERREAKARDKAERAAASEAPAAEDQQVGDGLDDTEPVRVPSDSGASGEATTDAERGRDTGPEDVPDSDTQLTDEAEQSSPDLSEPADTEREGAEESSREGVQPEGVEAEAEAEAAPARSRASELAEDATRIRYLGPPDTPRQIVARKKDPPDLGRPIDFNRQLSNERLSEPSTYDAADAEVRRRRQLILEDVAQDFVADGGHKGRREAGRLTAHYPIEYMTESTDPVEVLDPQGVLDILNDKSGELRNAELVDTMRADGLGIPGGEKGVRLDIQRRRVMDAYATPDLSSQKEQEAFLAGEGRMWMQFEGPDQWTANIRNVYLEYGDDVTPTQLKRVERIVEKLKERGFTASTYEGRVSSLTNHNVPRFAPWWSGEAEHRARQFELAEVKAEVEANDQEVVIRGDTAYINDRKKYRPSVLKKLLENDDLRQIVLVYDEGSNSPGFKWWAQLNVKALNKGWAGSSGPGTTARWYRNGRSSTLDRVNANRAIDDTLDDSGRGVDDAGDVVRQGDESTRTEGVSEGVRQDVPPEAGPAGESARGGVSDAGATEGARGEAQPAPEPVGVGDAVAEDAPRPITTVPSDELRTELRTTESDERATAIRSELARRAQQDRGTAEATTTLEVVDLPVSAIRTDTRRFQGREKEFSETTASNIEKALDLNKFDPITVWRDPQTAEVFVLAGHSRLEGFRRRGEAVIPSKVFQGSEAQAIDFALTSNQLADPETDLERAQYVRRLRENGTTQKEIEAKAKELYGRQNRVVVAYSYLDPSGKTASALRFLADSQSGDRDVAETIAKWIGETRRRLPVLTDSHESELYDYLTINFRKSKQAKTQSEFVKFVREVVDRQTVFGEFEGGPLNLNAVKPKSRMSLEADQKVVEAEQELAAAVKERDKQRLKYIKREATAAELARVMKPYEDAVKIAQAELVRITGERDRARNELDKELTLFTEAIDPGTDTLESEAESIQYAAYMDELMEIDGLLEGTTFNDDDNSLAPRQFAQLHSAAASQYDRRKRLQDQLSREVANRFPGVTVDVSMRESGMNEPWWYISSIVVPEDQRGQGIGTAAMEYVLEQADREGATVTLNMEPRRGGTITQLRRFYRRLGFRPNKGRNADHSVSGEMIRPGRQLERPADRELTAEDVATGQPLSFTYAHNTARTDNFGERYGQDVEPAGKYVVSAGQVSRERPLEGWEYGETSVSNPLVVPFGGPYGEASNWKPTLSKQYDNKTGDQLSEALRAAGHDAIVTVDGDFVSEIVLLDDPDSFGIRRAGGIQQRGQKPGPQQFQTPDWVKGEAETARWAKLIEKIKKDKRGRKYGVRSVIERFYNDVSTNFRVGNVNTTAKHPAHFDPMRFMARSRSGLATWNYHEAGHAIPYLLRIKDPSFWRRHAQRPLAAALKALSQSPIAPHASAHNLDEGFAEWMRLMIDRPEILARTGLTAQIFKTLDEHLPGTTASIRDAARAQWHIYQRPGLAQLRSLQKDKGPQPGWLETIKNAHDKALFIAAARNWGLERADRKVWQIFRTYYGRSKDTNQRVRKFLTERMGTERDARMAYQSLLRVYPDTENAITGNGMRVYRTGDKPVLTAADVAWFEENVPRLQIAPAMLQAGRHGDSIQLTEYSVEHIVELLGDRWEDFETYAQSKAALNRYDVKGHTYPGASQYSPDFYREKVREAEQLNPDFIEAFNLLEGYMNQLVLLSYMGGLISRDAVQKMLAAYDHYLPLHRDVEGSAANRSNRSSAVKPEAGFRKTKGGGDIRFLPLLHNIEQRTAHVMDAYYTNRAIRAVVQAADHITQQRLKLGDKAFPDVAPEVLSAISRMAVPLKMPEELQLRLKKKDMPRTAWELADLINGAEKAANELEAYLGGSIREKYRIQMIWGKFARKHAEATAKGSDTNMLAQGAAEAIARYSGVSGVDTFELQVQLDSRKFGNVQPSTGQYFSGEDVAMYWAGQPIFREVDPKATNVVAYQEGGEFQFYQIEDDVLFGVFAYAEDPGKTANLFIRAGARMVAPWKRAITQNIVFALRNVLSRDPATAIAFGIDPARLGDMSKLEIAKHMVPLYFGAHGLMANLSGRRPDAAPNSEMLSRAFQSTLSGAHKAEVSRFKEVAVEGILVDGWSEMGFAEKAAELPGQIMSALLWPVNMALYGTGQRRFSELTEDSTRLGAYLAVKKAGGVDELASMAYDMVTGNFGERPASGTIAGLYRTGGFINPQIQILSEQYRRLSSPDPVQRQLLMLRGASLALSTAVGWAVNTLVTSPEREKELELRVDYERLSHMAIGGYLRLPFAYGPEGAIQSYVWNSLDHMAGKGGVSSRKKLATGVITRALDFPGEPMAFLQPQLKALIESEAGYSFFWNDTIEPGWMDNLPVEQRAFYSTPGVYKRVSEFMNLTTAGLVAGNVLPGGSIISLSPIRMQYFIRNGLSRYIDDTIVAFDRAAKGEGNVAAQLAKSYHRSLSTRTPKGWYTQPAESIEELEAKYQMAMRRYRSYMETGGTNAAVTAQLEKRIDSLQEIHQAQLQLRRLYEGVKEARRDGDFDTAQSLEMEMAVQAANAIEQHNNHKP